MKEKEEELNIEMFVNPLEESNSVMCEKIEPVVVVDQPIEYLHQ
jgi:hypothetical protein